MLNWKEYIERDGTSEEGIIQMNIKYSSSRQCFTKSLSESFLNVEKYPWPRAAIP